MICYFYYWPFKQIFFSFPLLFSYFSPLYRTPVCLTPLMMETTNIAPMALLVVAAVLMVLRGGILVIISFFSSSLLFFSFLFFSFLFFSFFFFSFLISSCLSFFSDDFPPHFLVTGLGSPNFKKMQEAAKNA